MKSYVATAAVAALVAAEPSQQCLYCRQRDREAGLMLTYSYCNQTNTCLEDAWNYVARPCADGWKRGKNYDLDFCEPNQASCPEFVSSTEKFQLNTTQTQTLQKGEFCRISIDATQAIARVIFEDESESLGIDGKKSKIGEPITFESGLNEVLVYNGKEAESALKFEIVFSGAEVFASAAVALAATAALF